MESNKAIWDCIDNLGKQPADVAIKNLVDMRETIAEIRKTVDSLWTSCRAWEEKARLYERERNTYMTEMGKYFHGMRLATEDMANLKLKGKMCIMADLDEETAAHCGGDGDCSDCLFWLYTKRAMSYLETVENNRIVREEMEGRKRMDAADQKQAGIDELARRNEGR